MPDPAAELPELSPLDLSLINLLQFAPRITWGEAGEILGTHPTTLAVRWDRLRESGAAWMTAQIQIESGPAELAFIELESRSDLIPETLAALVAMPQVVSVESFSGERNLGLTVTACNLAELSALVEEKISRVPGVKGLRVLLASQLHSTGDSWRLKVLSAEQVERAQAAAAEATSLPRRSSLTEEHWAVAQVLMRDGRASAAEIARTTGLHPATARRHLQKVLASGAIRLRCDLAQSLSGHPLTVQWFTRLSAADHAAGDNQNPVPAGRGRDGRHAEIIVVPDQTERSETGQNDRRQHQPVGARGIGTPHFLNRENNPGKRRVEGRSDTGG